MQNQLTEIADWPEPARAANYSVHALAANCGVCTRQLERHFLKRFGVRPHLWLNRLRQSEALCLLRDRSVKEVALQLGFKQLSHFSRTFKDFHGYPPSDFLDTPSN
jgi:transcriptional regulator GlxA family with amidase domain